MYGNSGKKCYRFVKLNDNFRTLCFLTDHPGQGPQASIFPTSQSSRFERCSVMIPTNLFKQDAPLTIMSDSNCCRGFLNENVTVGRHPFTSKCTKRTLLSKYWLTMSDGWKLWHACQHKSNMSVCYLAQTCKVSGI